jgi:hypothetical protein
MTTTQSTFSSVDYARHAAPAHLSDPLES